MDKTRISREEFHAAIDDIQKSSSFTEKINDLLDDYGADGYVLPPNCECTVINLLNEIFNNEENDIIGWFCYELEFGKRWQPGMFTINGEDVKMATVDDLYDYLNKKVILEKIEEKGSAWFGVRVYGDEEIDPESEEMKNKISDGMGRYILENWNQVVRIKTDAKDGKYYIDYDLYL